MAKNISLSTIKTFKNKFLRNNKNTASRNALIKNDLANVALNWENFSQINHNFSNLIKKSGIALFTLLHVGIKGVSIGF